MSREAKLTCVLVLQYTMQLFLFFKQPLAGTHQLSIYWVPANGCCKLLTCVQSDDATSLAGERLQLRHQPISDETELRRQPISEPDFCHQPISNATGRGT